MLKNKIWKQTNINKEILIAFAIKQYEDSLDAIMPWLDLKYLKGESTDVKLKTLEKEISDFFSIQLKEKNIYPNKFILNKEDEYFISKIDYDKLYFVSDIIYPFWNLSFDNLYNFYIENKKESVNISVDEFIGRIKYLFDLDNGDFELFEKFMQLQDIKNS